MLNPVQISLTKSDGTKRNIIIEPVLEKQADKTLHATGTYKLFKDAFGEESALFTEPLEIDERNDDLSDDVNPDFLGKIIIDGSLNWRYEGDLLSIAEQGFIVEYVLDYKK